MTTRTEVLGRWWFPPGGAFAWHWKHAEVVEVYEPSHLIDCVRIRRVSETRETGRTPFATLISNLEPLTPTARELLRIAKERT